MTFLAEGGRQQRRDGESEPVGEDVDALSRDAADDAALVLLGLDQSAALAGPITAGPKSSRRRSISWSRAGHSARWLTLPTNLRASILMVASITAFSVMMGLIKLIGTALPLAEVLLIRQVIMAALLMPLFAANLRGALRTRHLGLQLLRGLFSLGSQVSYFVVLLHMPFAETTALGFSQVVFTTVAAAVILRERVTWQRWAATLVGFAGVLVMLKPTAAGIDVHALLAITSALLVCGVAITIRMMSAAETTATIMLYQTLVLVPAYGVPTLFGWVSPTAHEWVLLALIGVIGMAAQYLFTCACQMGEAAALAPLEFNRLLIAIAIGYFAFSEIPDPMTIIGGAIVVGSVVYTFRRNADAGGSPKG